MHVLGMILITVSGIDYKKVEEYDRFNKEKQMHWM